MVLASFPKLVCHTILHVGVHQTNHGSYHGSAGRAALLRHGLIRASFILPAPIRELESQPLPQGPRSETHVPYQPLAQILEGSEIKLTSVASRLLSISGSAMPDALVAGTTDPEILADLARGKSFELCARHSPAASAPTTPST